MSAGGEKMAGGAAVLYRLPYDSARRAVGNHAGQPSQRLPPNRIALQGANFRGMAGGKATAKVRRGSANLRQPAEAL